MPLTRKMPEAAYPTADAIRDAVPRPTEMPKSVEPDGTRMRWPARVRSVSAGRTNGNCCPIGLHPLTGGGCSMVVPIPTEGFITKFSPYTVPGGHPFWEWWDEQTDHRAAMDAVWGPS